ncbi:hypothetical protein BD289DRAFT_122402 [Coniella lustricola]|uniref:RRM domain-containing protein n=1 Tax=Coniella lustricola TaxID=2025994 RepID=A0A2T2ZWG6_9PEZI|nr:hypothetical protein BD289DRAFT_122402 [Coniella lustricola]
MPPKKEKAQKLSLNEFMNDGSFGGGNWADEVEETYASGTQPLPSTDRQRSTYTSSYSRGGDSGSAFGGGSDRYAGYARQEREELPIPDKPPYTAHLGNLSYDANQEAVTDFFASAGCEVVNVRIVEDRAEMRPKGFGYAEFATPDDLKKALALNEESFFSRNIRIRVADPPKDRFGNDSNRDFSDWSRKGPLPDAPSRNNRGPREFNEPREPREFREPRAAGPDYSSMSWERKGPLSPAAPAPAMERGDSRAGSRSGHRMGERTNSYANRGASPAAWGPGEGRQQESRQESRPPREPRAPTAAEQEFDWRAKMRPDAAKESPATSHPTSEAPSSPSMAAAAPAAPAGRPRLNLAKRTVSEAPGIQSPSAGADSKASPFGAARPIDTAAREREIEEKKQREIQEKKEADEKAKEEKRLAKEAAAKEASEKAATEQQQEAEKPAEAEIESEAPAGTTEQPQEAAPETAPQETETAPQGTEASAENAENGVNGSEQKAAARPRDAPTEATKSRANESGNWRSSGSRGAPSGPRGDRRGGGAPRGGGRAFEGRQPSRRGNEQPRRGSDQAQTPSTPTTPVVDADGWTTVSTPAKGRRGRPVPS